MVWSTTQSSQYETNPCKTRPEHEKKNIPPKRPLKENRKGLFEDGDILLIIALIMILSREKENNTLIFSLLIALML